jgi:predicted  nucleic acid-binding Zn ribbon protein
MRASSQLAWVHGAIKLMAQTDSTMKGGQRMKQVFTGVLVVLMVFALTACAGKSGDQKVRVKCPACGYEFNAPTD